MTIKENANNEDLLKKNVNTTVTIRLASRRALSGYLTETTKGYSIKLGIKQIDISPGSVVSVVRS